MYHSPIKKLIYSTSSALIFCLLCIPASADPKPVPRMQVIPLPYDQASFQRNGEELTRYHFGPSLERPFLYPIVGPLGRSLTRMGHPHDPESHSHHNSVWISHNNVDEVVFWGDRGKGKIRHTYLAEYEDTDDAAWLVADNQWVDAESSRILLYETRKITVHWLENQEWMMTIDLRFSVKEGETTLGKTPFGMTGVRMAKSIGVHDGGGIIRNSEGAINEEEVFRKSAKWVDYSGASTNQAIEGITLFDHPQNPTFPTPFHVRNDGWMGACLNLDKAITITPDKPLKLRYGLYIHSGMPPLKTIGKQWQEFSKLPLPDLTNK